MMTLSQTLNARVSNPHAIRRLIEPEAQRVGGVQVHNTRNSDFFARSLLLHTLFQMYKHVYLGNAVERAEWVPMVQSWSLARTMRAETAVVAVACCVATDMVVYLQ